MGESRAGLTYLVDTNVWVERLLEQERSAEVKQFLDAVPSHRIVLTEFAYYSIGLILTRAKRYEDLEDFVRDTLVEGDVTRLFLEPEDATDLTSVMQRFSLDFNDAYQYTVAEKHDLVIVSFDTDFDKTDRGRVEPTDIVVAP